MAVLGRRGIRRGVVAAGLVLAASNLQAQPVAKHLAPIPAATTALMAAKNTSPAAPILIRSYKKEAELEVWKLARSGRYVHLKTFPICRWSGQLGPKTRQGDRQAPEGFYAITPKQMNPNSAYYLSFDIGYPNAYDRAHGGSGSYLMVHGTCSSAGCYAMTDAQVGEIFALAREAFAGGQAAFQFQAYPFRMSAENMARHRSDKHIEFWRQLKEGSDRFEGSGAEPVVTVADRRYAFRPFQDPDREAQASARVEDQKAKVATLVADGSAAVRTTYSDGGQHPSFHKLMLKGVPLGDVSRPEALAFAGLEVVITPARKKKPLCSGPSDCKVLTADAAPAVPAAANASPLPTPIPRIETEPNLFSSASVGEAPTRLTLADAGPFATGAAFANAGPPAQLAPAPLGSTTFRLAAAR